MILSHHGPSYDAAYDRDEFGGLAFYSGTGDTAVFERAYEILEGYKAGKSHACGVKDDVVEKLRLRPSWVDLREPWVQQMLGIRTEWMGKNMKGRVDIDDLDWGIVDVDFPKELGKQRRGSRIIVKALEAAAARREEWNREDLLTLHSRLEVARSASERDLQSLIGFFNKLIEAWVQAGNDRSYVSVLAGHTHVGSLSPLRDSGKTKIADGWTLGLFTEYLYFSKAEKSGFEFTSHALDTKAKRDARPALHRLQVVRYADVEPDLSGVEPYKAKAVLIRSGRKLGVSRVKLLESPDTSKHPAPNQYYTEIWEAMT